MKPAGPIESHGGIFVLREDLVRIGKANGTKAAVIASVLARVDGVCTVGARESTQALMTARIADHFGIGCEFHCPTGKPNQVVGTISSLGFKIVEHTPGYKTVLDSRARRNAQNLGWALLPFGCDFPDMLKMIAQRCEGAAKWPGKRLVVASGSGMVLSGILIGLAKVGWEGKVLGVCAYGTETVEKKLGKHVPDWKGSTTLVSSKGVCNPDTFHGIPVDPVYSGGCVAFLKEGDLFWNSGARQLSL